MLITKNLSVAAAALLMLLLGVTFATPVCAQAPMPNWGAYDEDHNWRDAAWWYQTRPEWDPLASSGMVGRFRFCCAMGTGMVVVEPRSQLGPSSPSRMVGRLLSRRMVSRCVVVAERARVGSCAPSGMVGRFLPWSMVSGVMVVDAATSDSRAGLSRLVGRSLPGILVSCGLVVGKPTRLVSRVSSRLVGRLLPQ